MGRPYLSHGNKKRVIISDNPFWITKFKTGFKSQHKFSRFSVETILYYKLWGFLKYSQLKVLLVFESSYYKEVFEMISLPKINTHKGHILYDLLCGKRLQNKKLFNEIDSCASAARICELRTDGHPISDKSIYQLSREGKETRVKEYFIKREDILNYIDEDSVKNFMQRAEKLYSSKK